MENPIKMDDLGVPLFLETPISYEPFALAMKLLSLEKYRKHNLPFPVNPPQYTKCTVGSFLAGDNLTEEVQYSTLIVVHRQLGPTSVQSSRKINKHQVI